MSSLEHLLSLWKADENIGDNIIEWQIQEPTEGIFRPFPEDLDHGVKTALQESGYKGLYLHQRLSFDLVREGKNIVVVTGTASGKTLCYNLSILDDIQKSSRKVNALYIFPTKALTGDQQNNLNNLIEKIQQQNESFIDRNRQNEMVCHRYDGDTSRMARAQIRREARLLLTNPDMLHMGILPHHTRWADFFQSLKYLVIDEIHIYRGVFGSHVSNVLRRLKRICNFYGAKPQFILTSATIANPDELAYQLIGEEVTVIKEDGSPKSKKHFLLYNPPVIKKELGLRLGASTEAVRLASDLYLYKIQTIIFSRARKSVEMVLKHLKDQVGNDYENIRGYRSGYLPRERREIESKLRQGETGIVVATNALELGVDIGGMQAVLLVGYPGTIAATLQQSGRAGRRGTSESSAAILFATSSPIDQFIMKNPTYLFSRSPERALLDPDNLLILFSHLKCALFELPFQAGEQFGTVSDELVHSMLEIFQQSGISINSENSFHWIGDKYPAQEVSLRNAGEGNVLLSSHNNGIQRTIGQVDKESALWMVHPGAVYLHDGKSYCVENLDLTGDMAHLEEKVTDYYTEPRFHITVEKLEPRMSAQIQGGLKNFGDIRVVSTVVGFRKVHWNTREILDEQDLEMPSTELNTCAFWIELDVGTIDALRESGLWNNDVLDYGPDWAKQREEARRRDNYRCQVCGREEKDKAHHVHHKVPFRQFTSYQQANQLENLITLCPVCHQRVEAGVKMKSGLSGLRYVLHQFSPFFVMCDVNDLGALSDLQLPGLIKTPFVLLYEQVPAGTGLTHAIYDVHDDIISNAWQLVNRCDCLDGCPSCVGPAGESGVGGKRETLALLSVLSGERE